MAKTKYDITLEFQEYLKEAEDYVSGTYSAEEGHWACIFDYCLLSKDIKRFTREFLMKLFIQRNKTLNKVAGRFFEEIYTDKEGRQAGAKFISTIGREIIRDFILYKYTDKELNYLEHEQIIRELGILKNIRYVERNKERFILNSYLWKSIRAVKLWGNAEISLLYPGNSGAEEYKNMKDLAERFYKEYKELQRDLYARQTKYKNEGNQYMFKKLEKICLRIIREESSIQNWLNN